MNANATPGGPVASRCRTMDRRLAAKAVHKGQKRDVWETHSSAEALAMKVSAIRFLKCVVSMKIKNVYEMLLTHGQEY